MSDRTAEVERHGLNYVMEFDHVVQVHADGRVTDDVPNVRAAWAPELTGDSATGGASLDGDGWHIMSDGYTGQQGGGNVMHNSESIGAGLERDILATPGFYVAVACHWTPDDIEDPDNDDETIIEGWAVAYRESLERVPACTCTPHDTHMSHFGTALYCETEQNAYCNFECTCAASDYAEQL